MKLVGLTGGIACGKTSVSTTLRGEGITILDADELARRVVEKGRWGYCRVLHAFGPGVLQADGELDREALAAIAFSNPTARARLNAATHPAIGLALACRLLLSWLRFEPVVVVDMPLLFESGFYRLTRPRVLVACNPETQLVRLVQRDGLDQAAARARILAQMPLERKRALADIVLENEGSLQELHQRGRALAQQLQRHAWLHRLLLSPLGLAGTVLLGARLWRAVMT